MRIPVHFALSLVPQKEIRFPRQIWVWFHFGGEGGPSLAPPPPPKRQPNPHSAASKRGVRLLRTIKLKNVASCSNSSSIGLVAWSERRRKRKSKNNTFSSLSFCCVPPLPPPALKGGRCRWVVRLSCCFLWNHQWKNKVFYYVKKYVA